MSPVISNSPVIKPNSFASPVSAGTTFTSGAPRFVTSTGSPVAWTLFMTARQRALNALAWILFMVHRVYHGHRKMTIHWFMKICEMAAVDEGLEDLFLTSQVPKRPDVRNRERRAKLVFRAYLSQRDAPVLE